MRVKLIKGRDISCLKCCFHSGIGCTQIKTGLFDPNKFRCVEEGKKMGYNNNDILYYHFIQDKRIVPKLIEIL
jgi:hypothetical protein